MKQKIFINSILIILSLFIVSCTTQKILKQKDLLKESTTENLDKFGNFLWSKKNDSIIKNKKNLDIIKNKTQKNKKDYLSSLHVYAFFIAGSSYKVDDLTFEQRSKLLAYLIYYGDKILIEKNIKDVPDFTINTIIKDKSLNYYYEFEKNDYYKLSDLKKNYRKEFENYKPIKKMDLPKPYVIIKGSDISVSQTKSSKLKNIIKKDTVIIILPDLLIKRDTIIISNNKGSLKSTGSKIPATYFKICKNIHNTLLKTSISIETTLMKEHKEI
jgi:hypothetical protein